MSTQLTLPIPSKAEEVARDLRNIDRYSRYEPQTPEGRRYKQRITPQTFTRSIPLKPNHTAGIGHD